MFNLRRLSQTCSHTVSVLSRPILITYRTPHINQESCRQSVRGLQQEAPDYYGILGVKKSASLGEVKLAYFNMAKKFHPDTNKTLDARQVFSLIAEAYDVLSDPKRRAKYDETGLGEEKFGGRSGGPGRQSSDSSYTSEEMYQRIFGDNRARSETEPGPGDSEGEVHQDYAETYAGAETTREYIAKISFEEAFLGTTIRIQYKYVGTCLKCDGSGSELGYTGNVCPYCEGTGEETVRTGHMTARKTCSYCNGSRIFIKFKCTECEGLTKKTYEAPVMLNIPPGTLHGEVFRVDLTTENLLMGSTEAKVMWVTVSVGESEVWRLEEKDLVTRVELSPMMAALGGLTMVQTPARLVPVKLEPGTNSGRLVVVAEEGLRTGTSLPGDLRLHTAVRVPRTLTWRQARVFRRFAALEAGEEDKLVEGEEREWGHRLSVNVITADKVDNKVVLAEKVDPMKKTITETLRDTLGIKARPRDKPRYPSGYHRIFSI